MGSSLNHRILRTGISFSCVLLCLTAMPAMAADTHVPGSALISNSHEMMHDQDTSSKAETAPFQLILDSHDAGLDFDLGGSDTRKLQLQLNQPLTLSAGSHARVLDNGANLLGLDATLDAPLGNGFSLGASVNQQLGKAQFQSLGSIHCMNGILRPDSYTASGCQFVNEPSATTDSRRLSLGGRYEAGNASASINWFTQNSELNHTGVRQSSMASGVSMAPDRLLLPGLGNPLLLPSASVDPLQQFSGQATGIDLDFRVGLATDNSGDVRLGLAFTHMLNADYQGIYSNNQDPLSWTLTEPFNSARMNLEWSRGNFSTGVQGFYRESVNFLNRNSVDNLTTFDVHFTWRTPWKANLSVGASNVLSAGSEEIGSADNQPIDPLESIYGRIPYVRYKQDL
jgi:hypothetical protein